MKKLSLPIVIAYLMLQLSCSPTKTGNSEPGATTDAKSVLVEKNYGRINDHLDNFTISNSREDLGTFRRNKSPVYAISYYKAESQENNTKAVKKINGKDFFLQSYTEYLKDGRKRYKEYIYDHMQRIENFHYDQGFENLLLLHRLEPNPENEKNYYSILDYYPNKVLKEEIRYRTYKGTDFDVEDYTTYKLKKSNDAIIISINSIGYDSLPEPQEIYTFGGDMLMKQKPLFQSKKQHLKWLGSTYKPIKMEGYVFEDRNVEFTYDDKGFVTSETWVKGGELENKKEFEYHADYSERIEQNYHLRGTEKSSRYIRKYNSKGDLFSEQMIEYTGNETDPVVFEYVYDENNNWTERKQFNVSKKGGNSKTLVQHEVREITYFQSDSKIRNIPFPKLSEKVAHIAAALPKVARDKQNDLDAFNKAAEEGNYDAEITKIDAPAIKDFTPKFWKLKVTAFGDLDNVPGEEGAAVFETPSSDGQGFQQMLSIFRKKGNKWMLWHQTTAPILGTADGGMMGNPFEGITIANRTVIIKHFGGSGQKWHYRHIYRYQNNDWYLIGAKTHFGAPCDYFLDFDYNLSTGEVAAQYKQDICNKEEKANGAEKQWKKSFKRDIALPKMDDFIPGGNKFEVLGMDYEIYY